MVRIELENVEFPRQVTGAGWADCPATARYTRQRGFTIGYYPELGLFVVEKGGKHLCATAGGLSFIPSHGQLAVLDEPDQEPVADTSNVDAAQLSSLGAPRVEAVEQKRRGRRPKLQ